MGWLMGVPTFPFWDIVGCTWCWMCSFSCLYALFIVFVTRKYVTALDDFKKISEGQEGQIANRHSLEFYNHLNSIMRKRIQNTSEYRQLFHKLHLRMPGIQGLDSIQPGWHEFKLHLYLTEALGHSIEYLVQVSLTTSIFLCLSALLVALLAYHYQVAFMYLLPGFIIVGVVLF